MIDVARVLRAVPHFQTFCSVAKLQALVETLRADSTRFRIEVAGTSTNGLPIHHVRFGTGSVKALVVAFPHCNEPVGGLTVFSLLTLLHQGNRELIDADVEWHIVPCIDPDGALLNEGWSQKPFTLGSYLRNFHRQEPRDQVELSFPIKYKRLVFDRPTKEAKILQGLLTEIRPDFYFSLHNAWAGGVWYFLTRDIGQKYHRELYQLLEQHHLPLQRSPFFREFCAQFGEGIIELGTTKKTYDFLEQTTSSPEEVMRHGGCSWDYLAEIKDSAITFLAEVPYVKHPNDGSTSTTAHSQRQLRLRVDADHKFLATVILEEWEKVKGDLDPGSPFYRKIFNGVISVKDKLHEGLPSWPHKTRDVLLNPAYAGTMTEGERFNIYLESFFLLCQSYEFARLLEASTQTLAVTQATEQLKSLFGAIMDDIANNVDFDAFEVIDCDTLAKVQLGSGLIVLNSILEPHSTVERT